MNSPGGHQRKTTFTPLIVTVRESPALRALELAEAEVPPVDVLVAEAAPELPPFAVMLPEPAIEPAVMLIVPAAPRWLPAEMSVEPAFALPFIVRHPPTVRTIAPPAGQELPMSPERPPVPPRRGSKMES